MSSRVDTKTLSFGLFSQVESHGTVMPRFGPKLSGVAVSLGYIGEMDEESRAVQTRSNSPILAILVLTRLVASPASPPKSPPRFRVVLPFSQPSG
jgi:hypothetical protein